MGSVESTSGRMKDALNEAMTAYLQRFLKYSRTKCTILNEGEYRMALHFAGLVFERPDFFRLPLDFLFRYLNDVGALTKDEASLAAHMFVRCGTACEEGASKQLAAFLTNMKVFVSNTSAVSPAVDADVYRAVVGNGFQAPWKEGLWKPNLFNFSDPQLKEERKRQLAEDRTRSFDVPHDKLAATAVFCNSWLFESADWKELKLSKWTQWRPKVKASPPKKASPKGGKSWYLVTVLDWNKPDLFLYLLSMMPELMFVPCMGDNTITTFVMTDPVKEEHERTVLQGLSKLGCNFNLENKKGQTPLDVAENMETRDFLFECGFDVNVRNKSGLSLLERKTKPKFDKDAVCMLLEHGADVLDPNPNTGTFWIPYALNGDKVGDPDKFQKMVRHRMRDSDNAPYSKNAICQEILERPIENWARLDSKDLLNSVAKNDFERVKVLVALGAPTNMPNSDGKSCLIICAETGNFKMTELLVSNYADLATVNRAGENCFRVACLHGHLDLAKYFAEKGVGIDTKAKDGMTTLQVAYKRGSESLIDFCLELGCDPNLTDPDGLCVQFRAFLDRKDKLAEKIQTKYKGNINFQDREKNGLAHHACQRKDLERIIYLHKRGIDLELKNSKGRTVLMEALMEGNMEVSRCLADIGCDISVLNTDAESPLISAYSRNDRRLFDFLLEREESDPNAREPQSGRTLFMMALDNKDFDTCDALIAHGASINVKDKSGKTAIMRCVCDRNYDRATFDYLIRKGCAVNSTDSNQRCVLSCLIRANRREEANIVIRKGALVNWPSAGAEEPIAIALETGSKYWFDELLKLGANGMNEKWPVTESYLRQDWFSLEGLKQLGECNLGVGAPIPYAMENNMEDVLNHLWYSASTEMQKAATHTRGSYNRTPLMLAMHMNLYSWVSTFLQKRFFCAGADQEGATPIIYAVLAMNREWTEQLYDIVGPKGAEKEDCHGCSALTYADDNGWDDLCEDWFCDGISVSCKQGRRNIIREFCYRLKDLKDAERNAESLLRLSKDKLKTYQGKAKYKQQEQQREKRAGDDYTKGPMAMNKERAQRQAQRYKNAEKAGVELGKLNAHVDRAREAVSYYEGVLREIRGISRREILSNIEPLLRQAKDRRPFEATFK